MPRLHENELVRVDPVFPQARWIDAARFPLQEILAHPKQRPLPEAAQHAQPESNQRRLIRRGRIGFMQGRLEKRLEPASYRCRCFPTRKDGPRQGAGADYGGRGGIGDKKSPIPQPLDRIGRHIFVPVMFLFQTPLWPKSQEARR